MGQVAPRMVQTVFDTPDPRRAAEFWRQLMGLVYRPGDEPPPPGDDDAQWREWLCLRRQDGTPLLAFQHVSDLARPTWPDQRVPQQLNLDLEVCDVQELQEVHETVLGLGGALILDRTDDPEEPLRVLADPDGHPFCVIATGDRGAD